MKRVKKPKPLTLTQARAKAAMLEAGGEVQRRKLDRLELLYEINQQQVQAANKKAEGLLANVVTLTRHNQELAAQVSSQANELAQYINEPPMRLLDRALGEVVSAIGRALKRLNPFKRR